MSRADDDAWEDLVRRLEAADSSAVSNPSGEADTEATGSPGTGYGAEGATPAGRGEPGAAPDVSGAPSAPAGGTESPLPAQPPHTGPSASRPDPGAPRAVDGFDFRVDPALFGNPAPPSPGAGFSGPAGGHGPTASGPRDWFLEEDPDDGGFVPEEPAPILAGRPDRVVAWVAAIGLPLLMVVLSLFWRASTPPLLWPILLIGSLGAWLYLFWKLPTERADDGDDGARV